MKNSGIEWIGEIPDSWRVGKLKNHLISYKSGGTPDSSNEEYYTDIGTPWVVIADMTANDYIKDTTKHITDKAIEDKGLEILPKGTVLYAMYASVGKVAELAVNATVNQAILGLNFDDEVERQYIKYFLSSWESYIKSESNGTTQFNLNAYKVVNLASIYPSIKEQQRIAQHLDEKCGKIDELIANQEKQIEKLKEYKQSVITEAVTKGLDKSAPMKDSGIEWIGEIPQDWLCTKIKYFTTISRGLFNHRPRNDERLYNGCYPFIQTGDVARAKKYITSYSQTLNEFGISVSKEFPKGTLTMTIAANVGDVAILGFNAYFPDSVVGFIPKKNCHSNYLYYIFTAMRNEFIRASIVSTQLNLNIERVRDKSIPFVKSFGEQEKIADYLDEKCGKIDRLIAIKQEKIEKLQEYKKSLIYEYVTGKKEVV